MITYPSVEDAARFAAGVWSEGQGLECVFESHNYDLQYVDPLVAETLQKDPEMAVTLIYCSKGDEKDLISLWYTKYGIKSPADEMEDVIEVGHLICALKRDVYICKYFGEKIRQSFDRDERVVIATFSLLNEIVKFITLPHYKPSVSVESLIVDEYRIETDLCERMKKDSSLVALVILCGTNRVVTYEMRRNR